MRDLHPTLGHKAWGRRKAAYVFAALFTAVGGVACILSVGLGWMSATPLDVYFSAAMFFILWLPFIALIDNPGEAPRSRVERWSEFGFVWLLVSGIAQTFWELPWFFLDLTGVVHQISEQDRWLWTWWAYGGADTRYLTSNPTIAGLEFMAGFSGPVELYAYWLYSTSKTMQQKMRACWIALIIGVGLTYQTGVFFIAEWHVDWVHIQQGATGFWLKFFGLNLPWLVAPVFALPAAVYELAHWYRVQGYEMALQQHGLDPGALVAASKARVVSPSATVTVAAPAVAAFAETRG